MNRACRWCSCRVAANAMPAEHQWMASNTRWSRLAGITLMPMPRSSRGPSGWPNSTLA